MLIYGGLLLACLGLFMARAGAAAGPLAIAAGLVLAALGVALILVRARMDPPRR